MFGEKRLLGHIFAMIHLDLRLDSKIKVLFDRISVIRSWWGVTWSWWRRRGLYWPCSESGGRISRSYSLPTRNLLRRCDWTKKKLSIYSLYSLGGAALPDGGGKGGGAAVTQGGEQDAQVIFSSNYKKCFLLVPQTLLSNLFSFFCRLWRLMWYSI